MFKITKAAYTSTDAYGLFVYFVFMFFVPLLCLETEIFMIKKKLV